MATFSWASRVSASARAADLQTVYQRGIMASDGSWTRKHDYERQLGWRGLQPRSSTHLTHAPS